MGLSISLYEELAGEVDAFERGSQDARDALDEGRLDDCRVILNRLVDCKWRSKQECKDQYQWEMGR